MCRHFRNGRLFVKVRKGLRRSVCQGSLPCVSKNIPSFDGAMQLPDNHESGKPYNQLAPKSWRRFSIVEAGEGFFKLVYAGSMSNICWRCHGRDKPGPLTMEQVLKLGEEMENEKR